MAHDQLVSIFKQGPVVWNKWRQDNPDATIDLTGLDLRSKTAGRSFRAPEGKYVDEYSLSGSDYIPPYSAQYRYADLSYADLTDAKLYDTDFSFANFQRATLDGADLERSNFSEADLSFTFFHEANLRDACLRGANFSWSRAARMDARGSIFRQVNLKRTGFFGCLLDAINFAGANLDIAALMSCSLSGADFKGCTLTHTQFDDSNLFKADFSHTTLHKCSFALCTLVGANFSDADMSGSKIYGISAWDIVLNKGTKMDGLVITEEKAPTVTVDDIEVAQFIYLLLNNTKVRNVINTITSKAVLILGRFTPERKVVLDAIARELRKYNLLPIIFDFERSGSRDFTETIKTLAGLSMFVIADITNPSSAPLELQATVPDYQIPFIPIIQQGEKPFAMFQNLTGKYPWVFEPLAYSSVESLVNGFKEIFVDRAFAMRTQLLKEKAKTSTVQTIEEFLKPGPAFDLPGE